MNHAVPYSVGRWAFHSLVAALVFYGSGCCVSHSLSIKNDTGRFVTVTAKNTGRGVGIAPGKRKELPLFQGPIMVLEGSNMWFYPKIGYGGHPEAKKRVFRFGICQAGFGYFQTRAILEADGRLTVGGSVYEPETRQRW